MSGEEGFPGFPVLPAASSSTASASQQVPLTARSTVTDSRSGQTAEVSSMPSKSAAAPRNKASSDPLLTRLIYGLLAWLSNVPLEKGYSQVDWLRVSRSSQAPLPRKNITMEEVRQHKTQDDAWMVFRNRVYAISPYLKFHPGGVDMLMKVAGKDGTSLFMKYHAWVNIDALMEKCLIGTLADSSSSSGPGSSAADVAVDQE